MERKQGEQIFHVGVQIRVIFSATGEFPNRRLNESDGPCARTHNAPEREPVSVDEVSRGVFGQFEQRIPDAVQHAGVCHHDEKSRRAQQTPAPENGSHATRCWPHNLPPSTERFSNLGLITRGGLQLAKISTHTIYGKEAEGKRTRLANLLFL